MPNKKSLKEIHKETWKLMSRYVRLRDRGICITCGKEGGHAGHFKHAPKSMPVSYDERNINCQCSSCNTWGNGKLDVYAERLVAMYGPMVLEELSFMKNTGFKGLGVTDKRTWFEVKREELKKKLEELEG